MEGRAPASPPHLPIVPLQHVEFALIGPVLSKTNVTVANRIVQHVLPLLCIRFRAAQLPVPKLALPNRHFRAVRPCPRDLISPKLNPPLQRLRRKRVWCAE